MDIEVNDYIRTRIGEIYTVKDINIFADGDIHYLVKESVIYVRANEVVKHSNDILDLIEVGDILEIKEDNNIYYLGLKEDTVIVSYKDIVENIKSKKCELLSILTHEQYEQNCFRWEEN